MEKNAPRVLGIRIHVVLVPEKTLAVLLRPARVAILLAQFGRLVVPRLRYPSGLHRLVLVTTVALLGDRYDRGVNHLHAAAARTRAAPGGALRRQTPKRPEVISFFDEPTNTASHVVSDPASRRCAVVDSVLDYDAASGRTATEAADKIIAFVRDHGLEVEWILETHVHADHLSAAPYIKERLGGTLGIGENIRVVQGIFGKVFNAGTELQPDGSQFDHLFADGEQFSIGALDAVALHTPACMTYVIGD